MFANYAQKHLEDLSRSCALPELAGKRIVFANLALGGGDQPQQYFIATYFLEDVDLFINLEGFNEVEIRSAMPQSPLEFLVRQEPRRAYSGGRVYRWTPSALIGVYEAPNGLPVEFPILARGERLFLTLARRGASRFCSGPMAAASVGLEAQACRGKSARRSAAIAR